MGLAEGTVEPRAIETVISSLEGYYEFHANHAQVLKQDQLYVTARPEQLELERRSLDLTRRQMETARREENRTDAEDSLRLETSRDELLQQRLELAEVLSTEGLDASLSERLTAAIDKLDGQIARMEEQLDPEGRAVQRQEAQDSRALGYERQRSTFETLERQSLRKAPFAGTLELSSDVREQLEGQALPARIWLAAGVTIGQIVDRSSYRISVPAAKTDLDKIPSEHLLVLLNNHDEGLLVRGTFDEIEQVQAGGELLPIYKFAVDEKYNEKLKTTGVRKELVHIYQTLPEPAHLVQKRDLTFLNPAVLEASGWAGLARHIWPGCKVLAIGPQTLAILPAP